MFNPNHLHLIVKAYVNNPPRDVETLNKWFIDLVEKVNMKVVAGPTSVYVNDEGNEGITGTVTLATSHSSLHCWDRTTPSLVQFDLYSCTEFSAEEVIEHLNAFELTSYTYMMIDRNSDDFKVISNKKIVL